MILLAHRGASKDAPENTLTAFREAVAQGADGVELDVQVCQSGEVVVCHDERLDRLAGKAWAIAETPYWKLRKADVGTPLGFAPERIPLLEEVFDALPPHLLVNIELKSHQLDDHGLSEKVADFVRRRSLEARVLVSSFSAACLFRLAAAHPGIKRGLLVHDEQNMAVQGGVLAPLVSNHSLHPPHQVCTAERVKGWQRRGLALAVWTVNDPKVAQRLELFGVDYCITDTPGKLRDALRAA